MKELLEIDGSFGEGGGSILRLSAGYSILFDQPILVKNIRANRSKPGLRLQHVLGLKTLARLTGSLLSECQVGTEEITFTPKHHLRKKLDVDIQTAASIGLLLQPLQIAALGFSSQAPIQLSLKGGGTFGKWAPSINYLQHVTWELFKRSGLRLEATIHDHGFYPKGGARVSCTLHPPSEGLRSVNLTSLGSIPRIEGEILITNQLKGRNIPERITATISDQVKEEIQLDAQIKTTWVRSRSSGVALDVWCKSDTGAILSTGTILGERSVSSEELGLRAVEIITGYIRNDIPVDEHLSDQLIPLMAYVKKASRIKVSELSSHARTNLDLIKLFTGREYNLRKEKNACYIGYDKI